MPCVFPVLGMKLSGVISAQGMARKQVRFQFLASASGILASFWLIATFLAVLKISGSVIGLGNSVPKRLVYRWDVYRHSPFQRQHVRAFSRSVFHRIQIRGWQPRETVVTSDTLHKACSQRYWLRHVLLHFLGQPLHLLLPRPIPTMFGIFTALAVGMALPWIIVAAFPSIALALPKPGAWMNRVKYLFGGNDANH